ncbi:CaiB/BaiF CoA transferase family protein [Bacillus sp. KH172YL63]|uniref:CaiB/BaiF CoA transferase family protein n=1 Tax=Bacillus sp. KH172YL63 TaxID=2709784 RepID=UPI0013E46E24|nr:CaiB/BaiF CoA-transferase family protein [Bacillus sp. KH172YL63]BCB04176.1 CoA transferase [Bacillus sp. KH172YL63]
MLNDIKIIDFTNYIPGPFATLRLAELGAEIIKVEAPDGDPARHSGGGLVFKAHNRGKKSLSMNLKHEEGRDLALDLIKRADVVVESFRPGVMDKLGLGYESVRVVNPGIIYCSITGYGDRGDMAGLGSHDLNYMSVSGALSQMKDRDGRPVHPTQTFSDYIGGLAASERILAALVGRGVTGEGGYHCISIADTMASMMCNHALIEKEKGYAHGVQVLNGTVISYHLYETSDGKFVSLAALEPKFWRNFCHRVDREEWTTAHYSMPDADNPVFSEMVSLFKSKTQAEWSIFGQVVDCCLTPVLETGQLSQHPLFKDREIFIGSGQVKMHGDLKGMSDSPPPAKGEHTNSILQDWLASSDEQIREWQDKGVIR